MQIAAPGVSTSTSSIDFASQGRALRIALAAIAVAASALVLVPVIGVFASFLQADVSRDTLTHLRSTVIPDAALQTGVLAGLVMLGVIVLGATSAWLVAAAEFPGRRFFEWALVLPLAMPGYIVAYAYTDFLQFSGPVQAALRGWFGWQRADYWFPEIRSLPGAAFVFTVVLYPYVYLLARTAFLARTASMIDAARGLGLSPLRAWLRVDLPLARPAVAAGALLALMEAVADYGAASYFGLQTFTTAIYRAWFSLGDRLAASQLAAVLLIVVVSVMWLEHRARGQARFFASTSARPAERAALHGWRALFAGAACCVPIGLGFVLPVLILLQLAGLNFSDVPFDRYGRWLLNSVLVASAAAVLALLLVLAVAYAQRLSAQTMNRSSKSNQVVRVAAWLLNLGYAVPGAVIAVGILMPLAAFDNALDAWLRQSIGISSGLLLTGSLAALLYAYVVRYFAVAHQPIEAGLARITPAMDASARSLGSGPGDVFRRVHLPLLLPSALAGGLLVFVDTLKELPATLVLRPFNFDTLAVVAYQLAADERLGEAALPALTIVLAGVIPVVVLSRAISSASRGMMNESAFGL